MKIIKPIICQKLFAGFAILTRSTTTLFQRYLPRNPKRTKAIINATTVERKSIYASRLLSEDAEPTNPSKVALVALAITPDIIFILKIINYRFKIFFTIIIKIDI
jgi:hypothetical protein